MLHLTASWGWIRFFALFVAVAIATNVGFGQDAPAKIDFRKDVAPIFQQHCVDCHGPAMQMAELRLDQRRFVVGDDADPDLVKSGKSAESVLIHRLTDRKLGIIMPPTFPFFPGEKVGLADEKIATLKAWIDQGANWPEGVSLAEEGAASAGYAASKAMFSAIRAGDHTAVRSLIEESKELVNVRDRRGATPLMQAAAYSDVRMVQVLLDLGADVQLANQDGATALMRAAGDLEKSKLLLDKGARIDAKSSMGRTPLLMAAAYPGNVKAVELLLSRGANIADMDSFGDTCLTSACKRGDAEMAKALIAAGADLFAGGKPPLAWAAEEGNMETIACLLDHGAGKREDQVTMALSSAATRGPIEAVRLLIKQGADVNSPKFFGGYTPLMLAAYSENVSVETVKALLEKGVDTKAVGAGGETALSLARKHGRTRVVELLEEDAGVRHPKGTRESGVRGQVQKEAVSAEQIRGAAEKSVRLLQECGPKFFRQSGCVACHQQSVTSLAVEAARSRGIRVDETTAREQRTLVGLVAKTYVERFLERGEHPAGSAPSNGYIALGMAADGYPADEATDAMVFELLGRQETDGSWTAFGHRPPLEYSRVSATALALHAIQLYCQPSLNSKADKQIKRARDWLVAAKPACNTEHAFRLLGLAWSGAPKQETAAEAAALVQSQREDGGWSQLETLESDAYATGLTLYALRVGGQMKADDAVYRRGVEFLLRTQLADGSWHVKTRSFPFQAYFESGFPHGHDQWISAGATGFSAVALIHALPPVGGGQ